MAAKKLDYLVTAAKLDGRLNGCTCDPDVHIAESKDRKGHFAADVIHHGFCPLNTPDDIVTGPHMVRIPKDAS